VLSDQIHVDFNAMRERAGPYRDEAFDFVRQGLSHTAAQIHGDIESVTSRHVSGQQLCLGLRELAVEKYGRLAKTVLTRWGVHQTEDFGRIVFAMIDAGVLRKSDQDCLDDFAGVYEFEEAFAPDAVG
jgi:uncharacterized repeat protein (TIGR04138 family)